ncbi:uncharacterized protein PSANT_07094 [Moesziomyces antarcticus]|uniref:Extradiol ring-cleavage dioxygenase class III enzyme subunit B domain-containing protein n=1 Tax=Pseudozyma antarctica TaxID=84753 RepID=A0A5C3FZZ4_PSEA2|nr:uncharacterized protein PSANT_07094 [Moesziomyces antarcticus]
MVTATKAPVFFISHGGPPSSTGVDGETSAGTSPARRRSRLVFVSAHWQAEDLDQGVYVNVDERNPRLRLLRISGSFLQKGGIFQPSNVSALVLEHLRQSGVQALPVKRGIDHGVWCPLKVAFQKPLLEDLPSDNAESQPALRDQGFAIVGGARSRRLTAPPASRDEDKWAKAINLDKRQDFLPSHPTPEHFLPALVALGAAHSDEQGTETFALDEGPMGWNMYRWG